MVMQIINVQGSQIRPIDPESQWMAQKSHIACASLRQLQYAPKCNLFGPEMAEIHVIPYKRGETCATVYFLPKGSHTAPLP